MRTRGRPIGTRRRFRGFVLAAAIAIVPLAGSSSASAAELTPVVANDASSVTSVAFDAQGDMFVGQASGQVEVLPAVSGTLFGQTVTAGTLTTLTASPSGVSGLAVDGAGNLYMSVPGAASGTVSVLPGSNCTPTCTIFGHSVSEGTTTTLLVRQSGPMGLAFDTTGNLYIAVTNGVNVLPQSSGTLYGTTVRADVSNPLITGLTQGGFVALDASSNLYVSDTGGGTVSVLTSTATTVFGQSVPADTPTTILSGLAGPSGLGFDPAGNLYVDDDAENVVSVLPEASGTLFDTPVTADALTLLARGLDGDLGSAFHAGNLFIADAGNDSVDELGAPTATITSVAFMGSVSNPVIVVEGTGFGTVPASEAASCSATGLDFPYGNLFLSDDTASWVGGTPGDCIGLTVAEFTNSEIVFSPGSFYSTGFSLSPGDAYTVGIDGATASGTVAYAAGPVLYGEGSSGIIATGATIGAHIDPNGADTTYTIQYGTTPSYGQQTPAIDLGTTAQDVSQQLTGLVPSTTYHFRLAATNVNGTTDGGDGTFTTSAAPAPSVTGESVQSVASDSATLQASVDPNGAATSYVVQYGPTSSYGQQTAASSAGSGTVAATVSQAISGLAASTTYHYRFVATNSTGQTDGPDATFTTAAAPSPPVSAPTVSGESLQTVDGNSATVEASVGPNGNATTYVVQYGLSSSYGQQTSAVSAGSGAAAAVSQAISGLTPSATYHYRFVATNSGGTTDGPDQTFTTTTGGTGVTNGVIPPPVQGVSADLLPYIGTVLVNGKPLLVGEQIPFGATIDTTHGTVVLETEDAGVLQSMQFAGGVFVLTQVSSGITLLTLQGGSFASICGTSVKGTRQLQAAGKAHVKPLTVRSLWGNGHGHFEVKGHYAAATVRGTIFHVADRCDGTLVHVRRGLVAVLDFATGKTTLVPVGKSFLAKS